MAIKKILGSKYFIFLIFFLISLGIQLLSTGGKFNVIINGGDTDYPLNPIIEISNALYSWKNEALGTPEFFPLSRLLLSILPLLNFLLFGINSNVLVFVLLWALGGFGMYLLTERLVENKIIAFIVALFYMMNPYSYLRYHTPTIHIQYSYIIPPILLLVFIQTATSKIKLKWGTLLYSLLMLFLIRTINLWSLFWVIIPLIGLLLKYSGLIKEKISNKNILILLLTSIIINLAVIFMAFSSALNYVDETQKNILINYYRETQEQISKGYNFLESIGGWGTYAWQNMISDEKPGWQAFSVLASLSKPYLLLLSLIVPFYVFITNLKIKRLPLLFLTIFLLFLMTGQGEPFGTIYTTLFSEMPIYKDFFRDTWGYWGGIYIFTLSLLFGVSLKDSFNTKNVKTLFDQITSNIVPISVIIISLALSFILYIYPGHIIHKSWISKVPDSYIQITDVINKLPASTRILPLPLTSQPFGYTETNWGYKGPDILNRLTLANFLDKHLNSIANQGYIDLLNIENLNNMENLFGLLNLTGTDYVLLRKDFVDPTITKSEQNYSTTLSDKCFSIVKETEFLSLYKFTCNQESIPMISSSSKVINGDFSCIKNSLTAKGNFGDNSVCIYPNKSKNLSISNNFLYSTFSGTEVTAKSNMYLDDVSINGRDLSGEIVLKSQNLLSLNLSSQKYDLFDIVLPKATPNTCQNGVSNEGVIFNNLKDRLGVISSNKQFCFYSKVKEITASDSKALLKIDLESNNSSKTILKFFSEKQKSETLVIDLSLKNNFNPAYTVKEIIDNNHTTYYIYFNDLSFLDENTFIYLLLNTDEEYFVGNINDFRMVFLSPDFLNLKFTTSDLDTKDVALNQLKFDSYFGGTLIKVNTTDQQKMKAINFNSNFNSNWKVITISKNGNINIVNDKNHFIANGWSNGWYIQDNNLENIWIVYLPQIIYLVGILLSLIAILSFFLIA